MENFNEMSTMPSGFEVEAAVFHTPQADHLLTDHTCDGSIKDKAFHMKSGAMKTLDSMKQTMHDTMSTMTAKTNEKVSMISSMTQSRWSDMRSGMTEQMTMMRNGAIDRMNTLQSDVRSNPAKWAGIAAGAGFGMGILGRIMRSRASATIPHIVIIESSC